MKEMMMAAVISWIFLTGGIIVFIMRVGYICHPYNPGEQCEIGKYKIEMREYFYDRYPIGIVETECIRVLYGRYDMDEAIFKRVNPKSLKVIETKKFTELQLPRENADVCRWS